MSAEFIAALDGEFERRREGPICALCTFVRIEPSDLPPLGPVTYREAMRQKVRTEYCEAVGRRVAPDDGRNCRHFDRKQGGDFDEDLR